MSILNLLSQKDYIAYNKHFAKEVGVDEAIVFGELCSICNIHGQEFYFEQHRIIEDTCLTEYRIRNALKNLQNFGLVSVTKKGLPAKNYYSLNEQVLIEIISRSTSGVKFDTTGDCKTDTTITNTINNTNTYKENTTIKNNNKQSVDVLFERFWDAYPKKKAKIKAKEAFKKIKPTPTEEFVNKMIKAIEEQKVSLDWKKEQGQFIPYPSTWLNQGRWEDEVMGANRYGTAEEIEAENLREIERMERLVNGTGK